MIKHKAIEYLSAICTSGEHEMRIFHGEIFCWDDVFSCEMRIMQLNPGDERMDVTIRNCSDDDYAREKLGKYRCFYDDGEITYQGFITIEELKEFFDGKGGIYEIR